MAKKIKPGIIITIVAVIMVVVALMIIASPKGPETTPVVKFRPVKTSELAKITENIEGVSGKIIAVGENTITVEVLLMMKDTTKAPITHEIKVMVGASTLITRLTFPSPEKLMGSKKPIVPKEETLQISDLKVGDTTDITAEGNIYENLKTGISFVASTINVIAYE
jgi:hypothetical protein